MRRGAHRTDVKGTIFDIKKFAVHDGPGIRTTVFVKGSRYDKMMEAFGGVGVNATSPDELKRAVNVAMDSGKPTLINAVIDPAAGSESGRIGNLNPQSVLKKK